MDKIISTLSDMTAGKLVGNIAGILTIISIFIEITPIKINPITGFLRWMGRKINSAQEKQIDSLRQQINDKQIENEKQFCALSTQIEDIVKREKENDAKSARNRILRFGDEMCRGEGHTHESWDRCLEDIDFYESYCRDHEEFQNNKTVMTKQRIKDEYAACLKANKFL